jgi:conjugal transfer pilus assembly protein TraB
MNPMNDFKDEWDAMTDGQRKGWKFAIFGSLGFVVCCGAYLASQAPSTEVVDKRSQAQINAQSRPGAVVPEFRQSAVIPPNTRNQGLEDMAAKIDAFETALRSAGLLDRNGNLKVAPNTPSNIVNNGNPAAAIPPVSLTELSKPLPPVVNANAPSQQNTQGLGQAGMNGGSISPQVKPSDAPPPPPVQFPPTDSVSKPANAPVISPSPTPDANTRSPIGFTREKKSATTENSMPAKVIPTSSGLESVLLTGVNAGVSRTGTQSSGPVASASSVGSPFVSRIKGEAILPNGWRLEDLGDCFVSGTAIGILSTERANAIATRLSCIHEKNGIVIEQDIKAYAVDIDGIQGIVGKVVSKQGGVIGMAFLSGIAAGFGTAITPVSVVGNTGAGLTIAKPSPDIIAQSSLGQGLASASTKLADFYLQYASQMFPVIEIAAGTRATWVLTAPLELKPKTSGAQE